MRANSLALRLFLSATAWAVLILLITGFVLSSLYRQSTERAFDRRLGVYLRTLVADVASPDEGSDKSHGSIPASQTSVRRVPCGTAACHIWKHSAFRRLRMVHGKATCRVLRIKSSAWSSATSTSAMRDII